MWISVVGRVFTGGGGYNYGMDCAGAAADILEHTRGHLVDPKNWEVLS